MPPEGFESEASEGLRFLSRGFFNLGGDPMSAESFKRKLTAILSADVKGYSRLMGMMRPRLSKLPPPTGKSWGN